jgi:hypothetical protein
MNVGTPGCPVHTSSGAHGQPRACTGEPTHTAVIRWRERRCWVRIYPCVVHAAAIPDAEPMTDRHRAMLAERREQERRALAGLRYARTPTSTDRGAV